MNTDKILGRIKNRRESLNISQDEIALRLNISQSTYGRLECGVTPLTLKMFFALIEILELSHEELLT